MVVAYVLWALIARRESPEVIHGRLKWAFAIALVVVGLKFFILVAAIAFTSMKQTHFITSTLVFSSMFVLVLIAYGTTLYSLWAKTGTSTTVPMVRVIRNRLLLLCTYMLANLFCRTLLISMGMRGVGTQPTILVLSNSLVLFQGFFDSLVLGKLCSCCGKRPSQLAKRQISDDRIRIGQSVMSLDSIKCSIPSLFQRDNGNTFLTSDSILELDDHLLRDVEMAELDEVKTGDEWVSDLLCSMDLSVIVVVVVVIGWMID